MKYLKLLSLVLFILCLTNCNHQKKEETVAEKKYTVEDFKRPGSDDKAIKIALDVVDSMGGFKNFNKIHYLTWVFFDARRWVWNRFNGDVRMQSFDDRVISLMNVNTKKGKVFKAGIEITNPDSVKEYLDFTYKALINDSYWLLMPFKMLDKGVNLKYKGTAPSINGEADVITLTFDSVGVTPQNKYDVYVDKASNLVVEWAYYRDAADEKPAFKTPWLDYKKYDGIILSGNRGKAQISEIDVFDSLDHRIFTELNPLKDSL